MKPSPQITTDLWDQQLDRKYSEQLSFMIIIAQGIGLALIFFGLLVLKDLPWWPHMKLTSWFVGIGFGALLAYHFYVWHDDDQERAANWNWCQNPVPMPEAI